MRAISKAARHDRDASVLILFLGMFDGHVVPVLGNQYPRSAGKTNQYFEGVQGTLIITSHNWDTLLLAVVFWQTQIDRNRFQTFMYVQYKNMT